MVQENSALKAEVSGLRQDIVAKDSEITALKQNVDARGAEINGLKAEIGGVRNELSVASTKLKQAGGNINDPVVGWILAGGLVVALVTCVVACAFGAYLFMHRAEWFRKLTDRAKGKPTSKECDKSPAERTRHV